jgi:hypothetical protein
VNEPVEGELALRPEEINVVFEDLVANVENLFFVVSLAPS